MSNSRAYINFLKIEAIGECAVTEGGGAVGNNNALDIRAYKCVVVYHLGGIKHNRSRRRISKGVNTNISCNVGKSVCRAYSRRICHESGL